MDLKAFENLELIPKLLDTIEQMNERLKKFAPPLTTKKEVAKFLGVTERTINNYIEQGYLKEDKHFYRKNGKILVFIEDAVFLFRNDRDKGMLHEKIKI